MTIKDYIKTVNARIVEDSKSKKKKLVVTVIGLPKEKQTELESFAYKYKEDIVREILKNQPATPLLTLKGELHRYYIAKQKEEEYQKNLAKYRRNESTSFPIRPDTSYHEEYARLSPRAKAYLEAEEYTKKNSGKKKKAGEQAKKDIIELTNGREEDYLRICTRMKNAAEQTYFCKTK